MTKAFGRWVALLCALAFMAMYLLISYYNRLAFDDFAVITTQIKYGSLQGIWFWYNNLDGCLGTVALHQTMAPLLFQSNHVYLFNFVTILLLVFSVFLLLATLSQKYQLEFSKTDVVLIATISVSLFYLMAPQYTQCFYWFASVLPYIYPFIFLCLGFSFYLKKGAANLVPACVFFSLLSLTRIHFSFVVLLAMGAYQLYYLITYKRLNVSGVLITTILFVGMVVVVIAPGNYKRQTVELSLNMSDPSFAYSIKAAAARLITKIIHEKLRYLILAFPIALWAGSQLATKKSLLNKPLERLLETGFLKIIFLVLAVVLMLFTINAGIMYKAVKNCYYFDRVWTHFFFAVLLSDLFIGVLVGYKYTRHANVFFNVFALALVYLTYVFIKSAVTILPIQREYARAYDNNIELMVNAKKENRKGILYVHSMPSNSGFIEGWHIQSDTAFWVNQCLAYDYALPCPISDSTVVTMHPNANTK